MDSLLVRFSDFPHGGNYCSHGEHYASPAFDGVCSLQYFEKNSSSQRKLTRIGGAAHSLQNIPGPATAPTCTTDHQWVATDPSHRLVGRWEWERVRPDRGVSVNS